MPHPNTGTALPNEGNPATVDRFDRSIAFVRESLEPPARILDLGRPNPLSQRFEEEGFVVTNTSRDLDLYPAGEVAGDADAVTAFEVLEHLVAPFNVLREIRAPRLFATIPLRLWFSAAYRNDDDPWDRHFHEFEDWQFDWLLEKAGWEILRRERWKPAHRGLPLGVRPILRRMTPRWYAIEAVRKKA